MRFQILGAGAWGTALAISLARSGQSVILTPRSGERAEAIARTRENETYLPGCRLPDSVTVEEGIKTGRDLVYILACPSFGLREWALKIRTKWEAEGENRPDLVSLAKGLENDTLMRPSQVLEEVLPGFEIFSLSGPNFAAEVARGLPTAAVLAGSRMSPELEALQAAMGSKRFRIYTTDDRIGVELGGSLKNVYAIGMGICEGLRLGSNAKAALLTRSLSELIRLITLFEGRPETVYGLSGIGDLVLTGYGSLSRNRSMGEAVGRGESIEGLVESRMGVIEGFYACRNYHELFRKNSISGPILEQLYLVLHQNKSPGDALESLMSREMKPETSLNTL